jgi:hypothetical protein
MAGAGMRCRVFSGDGISNNHWPLRSLTNQGLIKLRPYALKSKNGA